MVGCSDRTWRYPSDQIACSRTGAGVAGSLATAASRVAVSTDGNIVSHTQPWRRSSTAWRGSIIQ
ncbi:MAG: hypothetical protein WKG01_34690 [Kofleriaceae bacterium]